MFRIKKRRMNVKVATSEVVLIRRGRAAAVEAFCEGCSDLSEFVGIEAAVALSSVSARRLVRLLEIGEIHFQETLEGQLLICRESMPRYLGEKEDAETRKSSE